MRIEARLLALLLPLSLLGCAGNEFALSIAPTDPGSSTQPPNPADPPGGPGGPWDPPSGPNPWDDLNPGSLPEVYFVAALSEWDCCWDCDGVYDTSAESDWIGGCPATYAVIDLDGQVLTELRVPVDEEQWPEPEWAPLRHLSLAPAGPGRFLAVVENWTDAWSDGPIDTADEDGSAFWISPSIEIWLFDAVAETSERLAEITPQAMLELEPNGRRVPLDGASVAMAAAWPDAEHPRLAVWSGNSSCEDGLRPLRGVDLVSPLALDWLWQPDLLLPPEADPACRFLPWTLQAGIDEAGAPSFLLGNAAMHGEDEAVVRYEMTAWSPERGVLWSHAAEELAWPQMASYAGWGGGGALFVSGGAYEPGVQRWNLVGPEGAVSGSVPADLSDVRPGPLLDPASGTFALFGRSGLDWRHSVRVLHRGRTVWSIEELRFGLQPRRVHISDLVGLVLPEQQPLSP